MLDIVLSQVASGLVLGGLYVLIAIGLSIIFGLLGIVNFAHGVFFTLGAYLALTLYQTFGWPAVILSPVIVGLIGVIVERILIRRLYDKEPLLSLIITFALALMIEATVTSDLGRHWPAVQSATVPLRVHDLGPDPDYPLPPRRAVHHRRSAGRPLGLPHLHEVWRAPAWASRAARSPAMGRPSRLGPGRAWRRPKAPGSPMAGRVSP